MPKLNPTLRPASTCTIPNLVQLLTTAYDDYAVPIYMDAEHFLYMCQEDDIDLRKSVIACIHHAPVGLALLSQRGTRGWISGVGVHPDWRGQGLGHAMMQHLQNTAPAHGLTHLRLETLTQNLAGKTLYQNLGFEWERDLLVLTSEAGQIPLALWAPYIHPTPAATLLKYYPTFHKTRVPWQRSLQTLKNRGDNVQGLGYWHNGAPIGYLLYEAQAENYAIHDLAVAPDCKQPLHISTALLRALHTTHTDRGSYIINLPTAAIVAPAFTKMNYHIAHRQHEMVWRVPKRGKL